MKWPQFRKKSTHNGWLSLVRFTRIFTWVWDLPKNPFKSLPARLVLNNWRISGIASFVSGAPLSVGLQTTTALDITSSPTDGARVYVTRNAVLPKSERSFSGNFRTDVVRLPARGTIGNAARSLFHGPGVNNWDVAVFKSFSSARR